MTKKDYELIAQSLQIAKPNWDNAPYEYTMNDVYKTGRLHAWENTCETLAQNLEHANPKFNRSKFLASCGLSSENS